MTKPTQPRQIQVAVPPVEKLTTTSKITLSEAQIRQILGWYCQIYNVKVGDLNTIKFVNSNGYLYQVEIPCTEQYELPVVTAQPIKSAEDQKLPEIDIS